MDIRMGSACSSSSSNIGSETQHIPSEAGDGSVRFGSARLVGIGAGACMCMGIQYVPCTVYN